jgi:hypothetical protein
MGHGFYELEKSKQEAFLDQLRVRGLDPKRVIGVHLDTKAVGGTLRIRADLVTSHLVAHYRTIYSIADLKKVGGVPDSAVEARAQDNTAYPEEPKFDVPKLVTRYSDPRGLSMLLGPEGRTAVKQAAAAYMSGNSKRVKSLGYEPIINALMFPLLVTTTATDTITVQNGDTAVFGNAGEPPQDLVVADITMYGTGALQFLSDYTINCQGGMEQQPA